MKEESLKNTVDNIELECLKDINEILKKHNCNLNVSFYKDKVLNQEVICYRIEVIRNQEIIQKT